MIKKNLPSAQATLIWAVDIMEVNMGKLDSVLVGGITKGAVGEVISE